MFIAETVNGRASISRFARDDETIETAGVGRILMTTQGMSRRDAIRLVAAAGTGLVWRASRAEEPFPSRPIRIVVPVAPGYNTDTLARILADELRKKSGVTVIVDNKAGGAGGSIGAESVYRADNDGYTLLFSSPGPLGVNKFLYKNLGYNPQGFVPVALISEAANVLLVRADAKFKTLGALIEYARANPGKLNYASGGAGSTTHLSAELFKARTGTDILHVPYKGSAAAATGLMGGQVDLFFGELGASLQHVKSGRLMALGVGTADRHELLPDVPPIAATIPGFVSTVWYGLVAPPKTPAPIVKKLSQWVVEIMKQPTVVEKLRQAGGRAVGLSSDQFAKFMSDDLGRWEKVIHDAGITPS
jgi:tripartite-type tricarboxylate transporter receptor subunit TctC